MDTVGLTFLLVAIINNAIVYFWSGKTPRIPSTEPQIDSEQNETDADTEIPPALDSRNAGEDEQGRTAEISTALVPSHESTTSSTPHDSDGHPLSSTSSSAAPPAPTLIGSYHEIVSAITRCVCV